MGLQDIVTRLLRPQTVKTSGAGPMVAWSGVGQPKWTPRRYDKLAEEGFRKNVIAYRCVMQVAAASAAVPWLLYTQDGEEIDRHPLLDILQHPNPLQDGIAFLESVYAQLEIAGNVYIEAVKPRDDQQPVELYVLRSDRMKVIPGAAGLPQGYQYSVNGQTTGWPADPISGASNILHIKLFHPLDDWYGMAPLEAALLSIDQHNAAGAWNQALLNQGARPSGALVFAPKDGPATLTDDQVRRLREELGQIYQGSSNAGRPLILEGGLEWREMSLSPKDMDWLAGRNTAARDIALAFGVPAQLVGIPDSQTYANMAEARLALYEETVLPLVTRVIAGFDHWLTPMFGEDLVLDFDPDEISALAVRRDAQWKKLRSADFLTVNEKRAAAGYGPLADGDILAGAMPEDPAPSGKSTFMPGGYAHGDAVPDTYPFWEQFREPESKYSPGQPRVPSGNPDGGQWTDGGGSGGGNDGNDSPGGGHGIFALPKRPSRATPVSGGNDIRSKVDRAADYLNGLVGNRRSTGQCAQYVRRALNSPNGGGLNVRPIPAPHYAKDYGSSLTDAEFEVVAAGIQQPGRPATYPPSNYTPARGDVAVIQNTAGHDAGHMALYNGRQWVSDFRQHQFWPASIYAETGPSYAIYRLIESKIRL